MAEQSTSPFPPVMSPAPKSTSTDLNISDLPEENTADDTLLAILPEKLQTLSETYDMRNAIFWFAGMVLGLLILLGWSPAFFGW
jgi:hypothetical protein